MTIGLLFFKGVGVTALFIHMGDRSPSRAQHLNLKKRKPARSSPKGGFFGFWAPGAALRPMVAGLGELPW
jgi:hypothetical protein